MTGGIAACKDPGNHFSDLSLWRHSMMNEETVIRDGQEPHMRREQGLSHSEPSAKGASARARPGILIFSRARQLLHINSRALELTGHLN